MQRFVKPSQSSGAAEIFDLYHIPSSDRGTVFQVIDKNTDIGRAITEDPGFIRNFVKQWDLIQFSGMSVSYVANRGWDGWMALREFIQNALDAEDVPEGKIDLNVNLQYGIASDGKPIIMIENPHGEIPYNAMILGVSEKPCWARGRFGEGLKLGMAWFASTYATPIHILKILRIQGCLDKQQRLLPAWSFKNLRQERSADLQFSRETSSGCDCQPQ